MVVVYYSYINEVSILTKVDPHILKKKINQFKNHQSYGLIHYMINDM